ncbi:MAG: PIN domain-containing protein [Solirubrobacteraceae bacterium]|nr:PIN domain-containing protein [Solirubrobacteraceae bacterium]
MSGALLDTSILLADDEASASRDRPTTTAISVVTLGELRAGVLRARDDRTRAARQQRLIAVRARLAPLPVDESVAEHYGDALAHARSVGRAAKATDLLIIATARATGRTLHTLDRAQAGLARELGVAVSGVSRADR